MRKLQDGPGWVIDTAGPIVGSLREVFRGLDGTERPSLWLLPQHSAQQRVLAASFMIERCLCRHPR